MFEDGNCEYSYGFTITLGQVQAWRQLVTTGGLTLGEKEYTSQITEVGGAHRSIAHFLDGSSVEIPGLHASSGEKKRELAVLKKPAAKKKRAEEVGEAELGEDKDEMIGEDGDEEEGEEEEQEEDYEEDEGEEEEAVEHQEAEAEE